MKNNEKLANYQAKQTIKVERDELRKKDNRLVLMLSGAAIALAVLGQLAYFGFGPGAQVAQAPTGTAEPEATQTTPATDPLVPSPELAENRIWKSALNLNDAPLEVELYGDLAPQAVANFVDLTKKGYFEGLSCHRLTTAGIYVLQCGDPSGDGTGGPGYNFGPVENAPVSDVYSEGTLAMARRGGDAYSMGSQFFIVYQDSQIPSDGAGGYTVFGKITSGLDAVKEIAANGTADGGSDGAPVSPVYLSGISVE